MLQNSTVIAKKMLLDKYFKEEDGGRKPKKKENSGQNVPVTGSTGGSSAGSSANGKMPDLAVTVVHVEDSKQNLTKTSAVHNQ